MLETVCGAVRRFTKSRIAPWNAIIIIVIKEKQRAATLKIKSELERMRMEGP